MQETRPALQWEDRIAADASCLQEAMRAVDESELAYIDTLYAELTSCTDYLTGHGGEKDAYRAREYNPSWAAGQLRLALEVAYLAHRGQNRKSGEPFIIHPLQVATLLALSQMDLPSLTAGLLHDTVEDTALTFSELEALFGAEVRQCSQAK